MQKIFSNKVCQPQLKVNSIAGVIIINTYRLGVGIELRCKKAIELMGHKASTLITFREEGS